MKNSLSTGEQSEGFINGKETWMSVALPAMAIFILLLLWEVAVKREGIEPWILPGPSVIIRSLWTSRVLIWEHSVQTILETAAGFGIAIVIAVLTATLADLSVWVRKTLYPLLVVSQTIPIIAVAPLFIIWFGYGMAPKIVVVTLVCFFL